MNPPHCRSSRPHPLGPIRRGFFAYVLFTIGILPTALLAAPEYIVEGELAPDEAGDLETPIEGFGDEGEVLRPTGEFEDAVGSYLPILDPWFDDAVFSFEPRTYYFWSKRNGTVLEEWAAGGRAALQTGWFHDTVRLGFSTYSSQGVYTPEGRSGTGVLERNGGGYWAGGEAYVDVRVDGVFNARLFRQEMDLPFFNRNDSRMTPRTHEAYTFQYDATPNLMVGVGHVGYVRGRNDTYFKALSEEAGAPGTSHGATLAGFIYRGPDEDRSFGVLHAEGWETFRTTYGEGTRDWELPGEWSLSTSAQFTLQSSVGDELVGTFDTHSLGGLIELGYGSTIGTFGITTIADGGGIRNPWGGTPLFNGVMISDYDRAGETALRVGLSQRFEDIGLPGFSGFANYVEGDTPEIGPAASPDQREYNISLDFRPEKGLLEGFWLRVRHGWNDRGVGGTREDFRVILNYSRDF